MGDPEPDQALPVARGRSRFDFRLLVAWTWLGLAVVATFFLVPKLGLRGLVWLGVHHLLCGVGCVDEIRRAKKRAYRQDSKSVTVS